MRALASSTRPLAGLLISAVTLAGVPTYAADAPRPAARPATLAASAMTAAATRGGAPAAAFQQASAPASSSEGFLKSRRGRIAAVLFVAGVVIVAISRGDAVQSPAR